MYTKEDFDSAEFKNKYHYDGLLGPEHIAGGVIFRLWAPTAEKVRLNLYPSGDHSACCGSYLLSPGEKGVWSITLPDLPDYTYYDYEVTADGIARRTPDPYAVAAGVNGLRSMVLDLKSTDPEGWSADCPPALPAETIIYEIHIKDFSWDPASGISPENRGKFKALCQPCTTLNNDGIHPTGIDYLKRLGITYVELMPAYDYGSVDESRDDDQFNWGYDPWNYNLPEGSYSSDPYHGEVRIREMKEAIASLHRNGFRVIMDVVYNHTYHIDSCLWRTVPWYYYRQEEDLTPSNGSGCTNDIASERSMCAKYIIDSVLYWTREYHIDGFRFDLMGLLDVDVMNEIRRRLDQKYGPGEKLLFGEPWRAQDTASRPGTLLADKTAFPVLNEIGAFCDATRDAVKGNLMHPSSVGFANGGGITAEAFSKCITAWTRTSDDFSVQSPAQTISYLSSHDDWTLWDRLIYSMSSDLSFDAVTPELLRANRLAAGICFCCQGHLFMLSGEEFGRTKYGIRDSVRSPLTVNKLDWNRACLNQSLVDYYRGLIALRKQLPGLCDKKPDARERLLFCEQLAEDFVWAGLDNRSDPAESKWDRLTFLVNASDRDQPLPSSCRGLQILVSGTDSFLWEKARCAEEAEIVPAMSILILGGAL